MRYLPATLTALAVAACAWTAEPAGGGNGGNEPLRILWEAEPNEHNEGVLEWLAREGWCWGLEVSPFTTGEELRELAAQGWRVAVHMHAHPETLERHWDYIRQFEPRPTPDLEETMQRHLDLFGDQAIANFFIEDDSSGVGFSGRFLRNPPESHAEAHAMFLEYLDEAMEVAARYPRAEAWGMAGYAKTAHAYASKGLDCVIIERTNDDVGDLQTGMAFGRGASVQYGCEWGVDFSQFWSAIIGVVPEFPASLYRRHMYLSHFGGAGVFRVEGGALAFGNDPANPRPLACEIRDFAKKTRGLERGEPDTPIAVLLAPDHGWMTPPYWRTTNEAWDYARLPYRQGQRGIDGFFAMAFPGSSFAMDGFPFGAYESNDPPASPYALSCVTPEFAPTPEQEFYAEPPIPFGRFHDRHEARAYMQKARPDLSPYRPMGDSRWGDIIDVLTAEAGLDALSKYPVVVLLGQVKLDDALANRLQRYVEHGGTLMGAVGVFTPGHGALTGLELTSELRAGRAWQWGGEELVHESFRFVPASVRDKTGTGVIAATHTGEPLLTRHAVGKGRVYTCLAPWFEGIGRDVTRFAERLFDTVIADHQPVHVEGPPLEWLSAAGPQTRTVVLANHSPADWRGKVTVRGTADEFGTCRELLTSETVPFERAGARVSLNCAVPAHDVRVLRWTPGQPGS